MSGYSSVFGKGLFKDQVILVTGGGTGIGRCIAHELASLGALVIIAARKLDQLNNTAKEIRLLGGRCETMTLNIRDPLQAQDLVNSLVAKHGKLTGLVNNAGGQFHSPASKMSPKGFATVVDLNLMGTFYLCKAAFEGYMGEYGGSIVNIVAECRNGFPGMVHTGAARAGIINMTKTLAVEWGPYNGIRINCVAPGLILSSGMKNYPEKVLDGFLDNSWLNPAGRMGTESEIASSVVFLLSPAASYINGINLPVDGASSLSKGDAKANSAHPSYNPAGSKMAPYIGWPQQGGEGDGGRGGRGVLKELDAPEPMMQLYAKYKSMAHKL
ncbi:hypothetical protein BGZ95_009654 [Linnemannia exigua]|uniref:Peroxisomal trans-2-enoyl-CoA reductase n=1 Tax=Linnemannia exigua TaxID=604196 RepID=A0AAD4H5I7_9FUNG|nr:hypothetical protein BGZ95_009654 [Linnemannia exigua]